MNSEAKPHHIVILCHPAPDSFNAAVAAHYCAAIAACGQTAELRDLYRMRFDPVLRVQDTQNKNQSGSSPIIARERALIAKAKVIVLVYPIWLGSATAMLKGYIERVFGPDFALRACAGRTGEQVLAGKHLLSFTSSGNSRNWLDEQGQWESLIQVFDRYLQYAFAMASTDHVHFSSVVEGLSERFFAQNIEDVRTAAQHAATVALHA